MPREAQPVKRVVWLSRENAERLDKLAEYMGMTRQQLANVLMAQSITSTARAAKLVQEKGAAVIDDLLGAAVKEDSDETSS